MKRIKSRSFANYSTGTLHFSGILKEFKPREASSLRPFQFKDRATLLVSFITQSWGSTLTFIYLKLDGDHEPMSGLDHPRASEWLAKWYIVTLGSDFI